MENNFLRHALRSKGMLAVLVVMVGFLSFSMTNLILRHLRLRNEIKALEAQAENMQQESFKTKELIEYLGSRSFNEKEARLKLNLLAPDEKVAVIIGEPATENQATKSIKRSNFKKWADYFFGEKK